jgi:transcription initiation factor TFIID subunit 6
MRLYPRSRETCHLLVLYNFPVRRALTLTETAHWLAVEGVQPSIPQNPTTAEARAGELVPKGPGANPSLAALAGNDNVAFKPLVKHVLSKELILFFDKIRAAILDDDPDPEVVSLRASAYASVRADPGLHQLVPYFVQFISEKVTHSLNNTFVLQQMMELATAMINNPSLFINPYVTALVPPVLTCLVGRNLGPEPANNLQEQYQLRDHAASLIGQISQKYAESSMQLRPRLTRTCLKYFLDPSRTLGEHYGAISGLSTIGGPEVVRSILLPNVKPFEYVLTKAMNEYGQTDENVRMVIAVLIKAISTIGDFELTLANGINGTSSSDAPLIEEYLGPVVGKRIAVLNDQKLNKAILESKEKNGTR